jgi:DNA-binding NarL/FixJ family response regulator
MSVDAAARAEILTRYAEHVRRFEEVASRFRSDAEAVPVMEASRQHPEMLTRREQEMLLLVAEGLTNREIGRRLSISEETVKVHVRHIYGRLQARSRAHAVAIGFRRGMVA